MERKDIVLKNLAEELKFTRHELLRIHKLDLAKFSIENDNNFQRIDYDLIKEMSENLMDLLHQEDPSKAHNKEAHGCILIVSDSGPVIMLDLIAKAFKAGNKVIFYSKYNTSHTYQFFHHCWLSVLASQGHKAEHIMFLESSQDELRKKFDDGEIEIDLCVGLEGSGVQLELGDFVKG